MTEMKECLQILHFDRTSGKKKCRTPFKIEELLVSDVEKMDKNFCKKHPQTGVQKQIKCLACNCQIEAAQALKDHLKGEKHAKQLATYISWIQRNKDYSKTESENDSNTAPPKRKSLDEADAEIDVKKAKIDTKATKPKTLEFNDEKYNETSYYYEGNLRKVYPYYFTFTTFTKGRWEHERLLDIFAKEFRAQPVEEYERCINAGTITVNNEKVGIDYRLKPNDQLANIVHRHEVPVTSEKIKIVHIDDDLVVVNKPASIPVHPCGRYRHNTVVFILAKEHGLKNLRTIHRLDRLTSGLLMFGRNSKKAREMEQQIRNRQVQKEYFCRVEGEFPTEPVICNEPIEVVSYKIGVCRVSSKGKDCFTEFQRQSFNGKTSVVLCKPKTGRMHQIRVHLQYLGFPIVNDPLYNHEVFGPQKGKGGIFGKSDEQLIQDLISIHNTENWQDSQSNDNPPGRDQGSDSKFDSTSMVLQPSIVNEDKNVGKTESSSPIQTENSSNSSHSKNSDSGFDSTKLSVDPHCQECKVNFRDPKPKDLVMFLHAWTYSGHNWQYHTELPNWAKEDWVDEEQKL